MGTLFISRMAIYSNHPYACASAEHIIRSKIKSQYRFIQKRPFPYSAPRTISQLLLIEARAARQYWGSYKKLLPQWTEFPGRRAHQSTPDVTNHLLDLGYHYLKSTLVGIFKSHDISGAVGLMHVAKTDKSTPLVYDLMELFRVEVVDREVVHYLRLKKKPVHILTQREVSYFLSRIKARLERKVYIRTFKQCHTYRYVMELQILHFIHAVNHQEIFRPLHIPTRHDGRCAPKIKLDTPPK